MAVSFLRIYDWFTLKDLDKALQKARVDVVRRYARGNVTFQNGYILDDAAMNTLRDKGDAALAEIVAQQAAYEQHGHSKKARRIISRNSR
jgi:hypothetical protein